MPELPEVETVVRGLSRHIVGQKIKDVKILSARSFLWNPKVAKPAVVLGRTIKKITRRGKGIIIELDKGYSILIHLKMTGQLIYIPVGKKERLNYGHPNKNFIETMPSKHTRVWFQLTKGNLYFNDQRRFGWVKLTPTVEVPKDKFFSKLGMEPFDKNFTPTFLYAAIQRHPKSNIKAIILDQSLVTGIGNIYSDEALFYAGIKPTRLGKSITKADSAKLVSAIKKVLEKGIKYMGTSVNTHRTPEGSMGQMQNYLAAYDRKDLPCRKRCGTTIKKIRLNGRGTHYCPICQK
jgi:formamidopyrimidine-DNA glycosylase